MAGWVAGVKSIIGSNAVIGAYVNACLQDGAYPLGDIKKLVRVSDLCFSET